MYNNSEEIKTAFIKKGWSKDTEFEELTLEDALKEGMTFVISGMHKGKKYFRMKVSENIFDERGRIVFYGRLKPFIEH